MELRVRLLRQRQLDVASDRAAAGLAGAAVGRLHDPGPAAGHHGETGPGQAGTDLAGQGVVRMILPEAGRAEDGDARADEVQGPEAAQEFPEDPQGAGQLEAALLRPLQEPGDVARRLPGAPASAAHEPPAPAARPARAASSSARTAASMRRVASAGSASASKRRGGPNVRGAAPEGGHQGSSGENSGGPVPIPR